MGAGWWFVLGVVTGLLLFPLTIAVTMWWVVRGDLERAPAADPEPETPLQLLTRFETRPIGGDVWIVHPKEPLQPWRGCMVPPYGWWCSRPKGHDGPCAARPGAPQTHELA